MLKHLRNFAPLLFLLLAGCWHGQKDPVDIQLAPSLEGDYLALVLSWSPSYCLTEAGQNDRPQCGLKANDGKRYAFVVHGLWPQYDRPRGGKRWPEYCLDPAPWIDNAEIDRALEIMPTKKLVIHQWKKHGTCYSKSPEEYVTATELLFSRIIIPRQFRETSAPLTLSPGQLRNAFLKANPRLTGDMISVQCGNRRDRARLKDIRFCYSSTGHPVPCGANETRQCRAKELLLPPVR